MCWLPLPSSQIFDSTRASEIVDRLILLFEAYSRQAQSDAPLAEQDVISQKVEIANLVRCEHEWRAVEVANGEHKKKCFHCGVIP